MPSEEFRRLRERVAQWGQRPLTGRDLANLMDQVSHEMYEAHPGPEPYDLSVARKKIAEASKGLRGKPGRLGAPRSRLG